MKQSHTHSTPKIGGPVTTALLAIMALVLALVAILLTSQVHAVLTGPEIKSRMLFGVPGGVIVLALLCLSTIMIRRAVAMTWGPKAAAP